MKKFVTAVLALIAALSLTMASVYAENNASQPVETNTAENGASQPAETDTAENLPIEEETAKLPAPQVHFIVNLDGSTKLMQKTYVTDEQYKTADQTKQAYSQSEDMTFDYGEEGTNKYFSMTTVTEAGDPVAFAGMRMGEKKGFFGKTYFLTFGMDYRTSQEDIDNEDAEPVIQVYAELPVKPSFANSQVTENGGKTLIWNVKEGKYNSICMMYTIPNITNIAIIVALLVIIIVAVILYVLNKKKKSTLTDAEIVNDALDNIEGKTDSDGFVDDPFASMTDEEINTDIEDEPEAEPETEPETETEYEPEQPEETEDNE